MSETAAQKNFREINYLVISLVKTLIWQKKILLFLHSVEKQKIYSHRKNFSSNQLFSNFFSKNVTFTKFLPEMSESKFP